MKHEEPTDTALRTDKLSRIIQRLFVSLAALIIIASIVVVTGGSDLVRSGALLFLCASALGVGVYGIRCAGMIKQLAEDNTALRSRVEEVERELTRGRMGDMEGQARKLQSHVNEVRRIHEVLRVAELETPLVAEPMVRLASRLQAFRKEADLEWRAASEPSALRKRAFDLMNQARKGLVEGAVRMTVLSRGNLKELILLAPPEVFTDVVQEMVRRGDLPIGSEHYKKCNIPDLLEYSSGLNEPIPFPASVRSQREDDDDPSPGPAA